MDYEIYIADKVFCTQTYIFCIGYIIYNQLPIESIIQKLYHITEAS